MISFILYSFIEFIPRKAYSLLIENNIIKVNLPMERKKNTAESHSAPRFSISQLFHRPKKNGVHKDMGVLY